ncbi:MAG: GNAT family N-acetyltransferase [Clostridiales bacterium]|nr:GNAT family N-acetyltransferase [Clostridiales bacterium]
MEIIPVDGSNIGEAAFVLSVSWQDSHRGFCSPEFVKTRTPENRREYLEKKLAAGAKAFLLTDEKPVGLVCVTGDLIEDLYVLPEKQRQGYGTEILRFAEGICEGKPRLTILENNDGAKRLYEREGFRKTGRIEKTGRLCEIEYVLD